MAEQPRLLLVDSDAFILLAGSGHLGHVLSLLELTLDDCRYIAALPFMFRRKLSRGLPAPVIARIEAAFAQARVLDMQPSPSLQEQLVAIPEIDVGEAVLFGILAENQSFLLTTNDKRALRSLSTTAELATIRAAVAGRIIPIESIARRLCQTHTVAAIAPGFVEVAAKDTFLATVFTPHAIANPDQCFEAIDSYLADVRKECGEDLFFPL
jgi:hypothetical protein